MVVLFKGVRGEKLDKERETERERYSVIVKERESEIERPQER